MTKVLPPGVPQLDADVEVGQGPSSRSWVCAEVAEVVPPRVDTGGRLDLLPAPAVAVAPSPGVGLEASGKRTRLTTWYLVEHPRWLEERHGPDFAILGRPRLPTRPQGRPNGVSGPTGDPRRREDRPMLPIGSPGATRESRRRFQLCPFRPSGEPCYWDSNSPICLPLPPK